jgi:hypothetical protein
MSEPNAPQSTPFSVKCEILGELWLSYRTDEEYQDFVEYNDLGLPLAYAIAEKIVQPSGEAERFINESWAMLLAGLEVEDTGFDSIDDLLELDEES